jgi:hypothetical protein
MPAYKGYTTGFLMADQEAASFTFTRGANNARLVFTAMRAGDSVDADLMSTYEENNERFDGARDAAGLRYLMARRAFAGCPVELAEACERRRCEMFV